MSSSTTAIPHSGRGAKPVTPEEQLLCDSGMGEVERVRVIVRNRMLGSEPVCRLEFQAIRGDEVVGRARQELRGVGEGDAGLDPLQGAELEVLLSRRLREVAVYLSVRNCAFDITHG